MFIQDHDRGIDQILSMFWAVKLVMIVFCAKNSLKSFKIPENHTFWNLDSERNNLLYLLT